MLTMTPAMMTEARETETTPPMITVPSTFMRKFICRLRLNEVSRQ